MSSLRDKYKSVDFLIRRIQSYKSLNALGCIQVIEDELPWILKEHDEQLIKDITTMLKNQKFEVTDSP